MTNSLLPTQKNEEIRHRVEGLITLYPSYQSQAELLQEIINSEGIRLQQSPLHDISGVLIKEDDGKWTIIVNQEDSQTRKLFTIAHELGHYFLHKEKQNKFIESQFVQNSWARSEVTKHEDIEIEANEFAANLIMPKSKIDETLATFPNKKIDQLLIIRLAEKFGVSSVAMLTRLKNLNYDVQP